MIKLRQTATLATRPGKQVRPLVELVDGWRDRAEAFLDGMGPGEWAAGLAGRNDLPLVRAGDMDPGMLDDLAAVTLATVGSRRATFTRANLLAEAARQLHGARFATAEDRIAVVANVTDIAADRAVLLTSTPVATPDPGVGARRGRLRDPVVYATVEVLDAETRLLDASRSLDGPAVRPAVAEQALQAEVPGEGHPLSDDQRDAVRAVVTSPRAVDVLVGAAGTGKTAAMRGVRAAWEAQFGPGSVVGLAPSAAAADVLADAVGIPTENTSKWLTDANAAPDRLAELDGIRQALWRASPSRETRALRDRARVLAAELHRSTLTPGRLVIVDEASMAATADLDAITQRARQSGAKVVLVGDWAQLSSVGAGGAFRLLATDRGDTAQLHDVRRFRHEWERAASTQLRAGDPAAVDTYITQGRVEGGDRESMLDLLHDAWVADVRAGRTSLMVASDAQTVTDLNDRARATRVRAGEVAPAGAPLASGSSRRGGGPGRHPPQPPRPDHRSLVGEERRPVDRHRHPPRRQPRRYSERRPRPGDAPRGLRCPARRPRLRHYRPPRPGAHRRHRPRLRHRHHPSRAPLRHGHPRPRIEPALRRHHLRPRRRHLPRRPRPPHPRRRSARRRWQPPATTAPPSSPSPKPATPTTA